MSAREVREAERREAIERRQQNALQMLRNIPFVEVRISTFTHVRGPKGRYVAYTVEAVVPKDQFKAASHSVQHRYSRIASLHEALSRTWGSRVVLPPLPPKLYQLSGLSANQIEDRRRRLGAYFAQLVTVLNWTVEPNIRAFLECDRWVKERRTRAVERE